MTTNELPKPTGNIFEQYLDNQDDLESKQAVAAEIGTMAMDTVENPQATAEADLGSVVLREMADTPLEYQHGVGFVDETSGMVYVNLGAGPMPMESL